MRKEHKIVYSADREKRVVIFERDDGSFGFEAQEFSDDPLEMNWIRFGKYSESFCDSIESAEREGHERVLLQSSRRAQPRSDEGD